jgi:hypothetical protein
MHLHLYVLFFVNKKREQQQFLVLCVVIYLTFYSYLMRSIILHLSQIYIRNVYIFLNAFPTFCCTYPIFLLLFIHTSFVVKKIYIQYI